MFWNSVLGVAARASFLVPVEFEDSSLSPCFQESEFWAFFLSRHLKTFDFLALGGPYRFPRTSLTTLSFFDIPRIDRISKILRRIFPRPPRAAWHQVDGSRLRWNHWFRLRHRRTFTGSRCLTSLTWRSAFRSDQKGNCWNGCRRTSRNSLDAVRPSSLLTWKNPQINTLVFWFNISASSERFNFCRRFSKTFSKYWSSEICKWW